MNTTFTKFSVLIAVSLLAIGCARDPSKDVAAAKVSPAKTAKTADTPAPKAANKPAAEAKPAAAAATAAAKSIQLGGAIVFIGSKVTGSHTNRFNEWSGEAKMGAKPEDTTFNFTVKTASAEADYLDRKPWSGKLQKHLLSEDFFHVTKFPTATFESTAIKAKTGDAKWSHTVDGKLTIRGVTKDISFPAKINTTPTFSAQTEFSINRKDFGIVYKGKADDLVREGVVLKIDLKPKS